MQKQEIQATRNNIRELFKAKMFEQVLEKTTALLYKVPLESEWYFPILKINADALEAVCQYSKAIEMYEEVKKGLFARNKKITSGWIEAELGIVKCLSMLKDGDERLTILKQLEGNIIEVQGSKSANFAKVKLELGNTYMEQGEYNQALKELVQCQNILQKSINEDYIHCRATMGFLYSRQGKYKEALQYLGETEKIATKTVGKKNYAYIVTKRNLASANSFLANYKIAGQILQETKALSIQCFGKKHPLYASVLNVEGANHHRQKSTAQKKKALACYEEAKDIVKSIFGEEHMQYIYLIYNLAGIYSSSNKTYKEAEQNFKEALRCWEALKGKENPRYVDFQIGMAKFYYRVNDLTLAEKFLDEAEEIYGRNHFGTPTTVINLYSARGMILKQRGKLEEAKNFYEKVAKLRASILGEEHPEYASAIKEIDSINVKMSQISSSSSLSPSKSEEINKIETPMAKNITPEEYQERVKLMMAEKEELLEQLSEKDFLISSLKSSMGVSQLERQKEYVPTICLKLVKTVLHQDINLKEILVFGMLALPNGSKKQVNPIQKIVENHTVLWNWRQNVSSSQEKGWAISKDQIILDQEGDEKQFKIQYNVFKVEEGQLGLLGSLTINLLEQDITGASKVGVIEGEKMVGKLEYRISVM